jgi:hypothetical protein
LLVVLQLPGLQVELLALWVWQAEQQAVLAGARTQRLALHPADVAAQLGRLLRLQRAHLLRVLLLQQLLRLADGEGCWVPLE